MLDLTWITIVFHGNECLLYFVHAILCYEHTIPLKNNHRSLILPSSPTTIFSVLALWRHHSWFVTSRKRALWRHIRRLFLLLARANWRECYLQEWITTGIHGLWCKKKCILYGSYLHCTPHINTRAEPFQTEWYKPVYQPFMYWNIL